MNSTADAKLGTALADAESNPVQSAVRIPAAPVFWNFQFGRRFPGIPEFLHLPQIGSVRLKNTLHVIAS